MSKIINISHLPILAWFFFFFEIKLRVYITEERPPHHLLKRFCCRICRRRLMSIHLSTGLNKMKNSEFNPTGLFSYNYAILSCANLSLKLLFNRHGEESSRMRNIYLSLLLPQFSFVFFAGLQFVFSNVMVIYLWIPILFVVVQCLVSEVVCLIMCCWRSNFHLNSEDQDLALSCSVAFLFLLYSILFCTLFNYSQYFYYGNADYNGVVKQKLASRSTAKFFDVLRKSVSQKWHTALNFLWFKKLAFA
jgi:hypothetical protein